MYVNVTVKSALHKRAIFTNTLLHSICISDPYYTVTKKKTDFFCQNPRDFIKKFFNIKPILRIWTYNSYLPLILPTIVMKVVYEYQ